jgi:hypothetical protein
MAVNNNQVYGVNSYAVDLEHVPVQVFMNGASSPTSCKGPFSPTCVRDAAGQYTLTLTGWNPKVVYGCHAVGVDAANLRDTRVDVEGSFTITNGSTKTVVVKFTVSNLAGTAKSPAANAGSYVLLSLWGKTFSGTDGTQR